MTFHLSHEQLCDLIAADLDSLHDDPGLRDPATGEPIPDPVLFLVSRDGIFHRSTSQSIVEEHLRACPVCSAELKTLRDSLAHFRDASTAYSRQQFAHTNLRWSSIAPAPHRYLSQPIYWAAAVLTIVAALFPLSFHHSASGPDATKTTLSAPASAEPAESDEDLLADINQKVDADVPSPLEPLASPVATTTETSSDQRKN